MSLLNPFADQVRAFSDEDRLMRTAASWQLALRLLVAPFYAGLFVITAVGAMFDKRT